MIRHAVMWTLKDQANGRSKDENAIEMKKRLEDLTKTIPEIRKLEVGIKMKDSPFANFDIFLDTHFDNLDDLKSYQIHPAHQDIVKWIANVEESRASVDYESEW